MFKLCKMYILKENQNGKMDRLYKALIPVFLKSKRRRTHGKEKNSCKTHAPEKQSGCKSET